MSKTVLFGDAGAYTTAANPSLLPSGKIGVYSISASGTFTLLSSAAGVTAAVKALPIMVAQGGVTSGNFKNVIIYPGGVVSSPAAATSYVAPIPDIDIVGYPGSGTDTINASVAGTYNLNITNTTLGTIPMPYNLASTYYQTSAAATAFQVAYDWASLVNGQTLNTGRYPYDRFVFASVLCNTSSTQLATSAPANITGTFTNGSTAVTLSGTPATALAVGSFVRVGSATSTLAPVYRVAAQSTTSLTLDKPYVNSNLTIGATVASVAMGTVNTAPTSGTLAGVRLVSFGNWFNGTNFVESRPNNSIAAGVTGNALGTPIITNRTTAQSYLSSAGAVTSGIRNAGYGTGWQAQKQEFEMQGFQGNMNRSFLPYPVQYFASPTGTYDGYNLEYFSFPNNGAEDGNFKRERHSLTIFCTTPATDSGDTLATAVLPEIFAAYA
jgi:hypothetical protein